MNLEIVDGWLVERGAYPAEYPAGPEWGPQPYSDSEPLVRLETVPGYSALVAEIAANTLRELATYFTDWDVIQETSHGTADYIMREANRIEAEAK